MKRYSSLFLVSLGLTLSSVAFASNSDQEERVIQSVPQRKAEYHDPRVQSSEATTKRLTQKSSFILKEMAKKKRKDEAEMARIPKTTTVLPADTDGARLETSKSNKRPRVNR